MVRVLAGADPRGRGLLGGRGTDQVLRPAAASGVLSAQLGHPAHTVGPRRDQYTTL